MEAYMRGKKFGVNIPWWAVIVALACAAPVGVVLAIIKLFPTEITDMIRKHLPKLADYMGLGTFTVSETAEEIRKEQNHAAPKRQYTKQKKLKRRSKSFRLVAVILWAIAALFWITSIVEGLGRDEFSAALFFTLAGGAFAIASYFSRRHEENRSRFLAIIGLSDSVPLQKLAAVASCRLSAARRDLQVMIDDGVFGPRAYIDEALQCFMRFPEALPETHTESSQPSGAKTADAGSASVGCEDYDAILRRMRELDDLIADVPVSNRIVRIEKITRHMFEYVADFPDKKNQLRTFMNYYLPTTLKLLESYSRIERVGVVGKNMRETKENIEKTLDMLVAGFETQLDLLYGAENVDISSDIEVLEQMMRRDGLKENTDFSKPE